MGSRQPLVLSSRVTIPHRRADVWDVLTDVESWPRWCTPLRRLVHHEPLNVGARIAYVLAMGPGIPITFDVELQEVEPPSTLTWWSTKWWGVSATRSFRLTEAEDGVTEVEDRKTFESAIWPVATLYPRGIVGQMSDGWLESLAAEVTDRQRR